MNNPILLVEIRFDYGKTFNFTTDLEGAWHLYYWIQEGMNHRIFGSCEETYMSVTTGSGFRLDMRKGMFYTPLKDNELFMTLKREELPKRVPLTVVHIPDEGEKKA